MIYIQGKCSCRRAEYTEEEEEEIRRRSTACSQHPPCLGRRCGVEQQALQRDPLPALGQFGRRPVPVRRVPCRPRLAGGAALGLAAQVEFESKV